MGNNQQKFQSIKIKAEDWEKKAETPLYDIMINKKTQKEGDYYHFIIPGDKKLEEELEDYLYRSTAKENLVQVIGVDVTNNGLGFCGSQQFARVMTQRIVQRLSTIEKLNEKNQSIVLFNALKGFKAIYKKWGNFKVSTDQIGFNQQGQTKVWLNQNYGMNYRSQSGGGVSQIKPQDEERGIIKDTLTIIQAQSSNPFHSQLKNSLLGSKTITEALDKILQFRMNDKDLNFNKINLRQRVGENLNYKLYHQIEQQKGVESKNLPPLKTFPYNYYEKNQSINVHNVKPIGPFPHLNSQQSPSKFITLTGKNTSGIHSGSKTGQQAIGIKPNQFITTTKIKTSNPNNKIRFSYDKH